MSGGAIVMGLEGRPSLGVRWEGAGVRVGTTHVR